MKSSAILIFLVMNLLVSFGQSKLDFDLKKAEYLYHFAYECIDQEYPNKPNGVLGDDSYLLPPREIHPAFYGCFDWHSSVHGHWTLVTILSEFPDFEYRNEIIAKLKKNITAVNIQKEIEYFNNKNNSTYERTYGWAWLLKLDEALREWDAPEAVELQTNLSPLVDTLAVKFTGFLDKLVYPIRIGEHSNIAFGMSFAYDWAKKYNAELAAKIEEKALEYYSEDCDCPLTWEPGGFDFLSPCLQEASMMQKVLPKKDFEKWLKKFLPGFEKVPAKYLDIAEVTDRSDGKLAHLDGLNFSRAWCLFEMGHSLNNQKMIDLGIQHFNYSYEKMDSGEYAGAHWLASFAVYALIKSQE
ncbi:DUF2891 domain-containing protein [Maribellus sediminis]|uniref:DUF2891 domain-containing protein n=1 Tax=Maribellus sediminis TaxID=2696285 RepID=UPI001430CDEA|nr:DUF2891 domain-containing protein [Maribellus sediminis]